MSFRSSNSQSGQFTETNTNNIFSFEDKIAYKCFFVLMVSIIFLQKFGVAFSEETIIPIGLPVAYLVVGYGILCGILQIDLVGLFFFSSFVVFGLFALGLNNPASVPSFFLVNVLAFTFIFYVKVEVKTFMRCMNLFIKAMLLTTPVVLTEWGLQLIFGPGMWVNLDAVFPSSVLVPGYMYQHPTSFQSPWMQPNAGIFLEVSILSQFLAIAFMIELAYFRRPINLAILSATMFITLGGSGPFLFALSTPFFLLYTPPKLLVPGAIFAVFLLIALSFTSVFPDFVNRIYEYQDPMSSTHGRLVVPFQMIGELLSEGKNFFFGNGPGTGDIVGAGFPPGKLFYEYGLLATICYYCIFFRMLFRSGHSLLAIWTLFMYFSFLGGGLGVAVYPLACMTLGGFLSIRGVGDQRQSLLYQRSFEANLGSSDRKLRRSTLFTRKARKPLRTSSDSG